MRGTQAGSGRKRGFRLILCLLCADCSTGKREHSPSAADGDAARVDRHAERARAVRDGQGRGLSDGVGDGAMNNLGRGRTVGDIGGDDFGGV